MVMMGDVGGRRDDSGIPEHSATFVRQARVSSVADTSSNTLAVIIFYPFSM